MVLFSIYLIILSLTMKQILNIFLKKQFRLLILIGATLCISGVFAQQKFDPELLKSPTTNGSKIANNLITEEIPEFVKSDKNCVILKNGFRQSTFINSSDWTSIKDSVNVERVEIVYSKYPIRGKVYHEIYPLLFNRIKATIAMDPKLNNEKIQWTRVWQTHCIDNSQVDGLFHGVVIWYSRIDKSDAIIKTEVVNTTKETKSKIDKLTKQHEEFLKEEEKFEEVDASIEFILNSPHLPDSIREKLEKKSLDKKIIELQKYFISLETTDDLSENVELTRLRNLNEVDLFLAEFPNVEPIILKVLDRHPEWRNKIVINDWTGSMYGYGAQVVEWHLMNLDSSGISTITLFNDGDNKTTQNKKIGSTGGIYTAKTSDIPELISLFNTVMTKGGGGDSPENDIEAILEAINNQPESSEIILIADNRACVRDIELANSINRPVRIILCGYDPKQGVNAHYVYLAKVTGGGLYTIDDDVEELNATIGPDGSIVDFNDDRIILTSPQCYSGDFAKITSQVFNLRNAKWHKKSVRILNVNYNGLNELPKYVYKLRNLQILIASNNNLHEISGNITNLVKLSSIDVSHNQLSSLPKEFRNLKYVESLNFSYNDFDTIPNELIDLKFLKTIDFSNNNLTEFIRLKSKQLTIVNISNNGLSKLPSMRRYSNLYELNLSGNNFPSIPENLPLNKKLQVLNLANNKLTLLPEELSDFVRLKILDLSGNDFSWTEQYRIRQMLFYTDVRF